MISAFHCKDPILSFSDLKQYAEILHIAACMLGTNQYFLGIWTIKELQSEKSKMSNKCP